MTGKRSYLLSSADTYTLEDIGSSYDEKAQINVIQRDDGTVPLVQDEWFGRTSSKTMQAPGDDDPDREAGGCY